jgi:hypothetical protein
MIATDRVMRCERDELKTAPLIFVGGKMKYYDPPGAEHFLVG